MGQIVRGQNSESQRFRSESSAFGPSRGALKPFSPAQASQAIEKVDSARENPSKSKSKEPLHKADFGADRGARIKSKRRASRLGGRAAPQGLASDRAAARRVLRRPQRVRKNFAFHPVQPSEKTRSATLNGGKRRKTATSERRNPFCSRVLWNARPQVGRWPHPASHRISLTPDWYAAPASSRRSR
jgi:hypothetical protein